MNIDTFREHGIAEIGPSLDPEIAEAMIRVVQQAIAEEVELVGPEHRSIVSKSGDNKSTFMFNTETLNGLVKTFGKQRLDVFRQYRHETEAIALELYEGLGLTAMVEDNEIKESPSRINIVTGPTSAHFDRNLVTLHQYADGDPLQVAECNWGDIPYRRLFEYPLNRFIDDGYGLDPQKSYAMLGGQAITIGRDVLRQVDLGNTPQILHQAQDDGERQSIVFFGGPSTKDDHKTTPWK
jgi:hypothetical protein